MGIETAAPGEGFRWAPEGGNPAVEAFHAVRRMTYASTGNRDPAELVRTGQGACTAKHLLLCELLRSIGLPARVETMFGHFGGGLPEASDMPDELKVMIREGGVPDYHNVVTAEIDGETVVLDATWHDALAPRGFPVNADWQGRGSTRPAVDGTLAPMAGAHPAVRKAELVGALAKADRDRRRRFLDPITQYSVTR
jgi:hypothetical protein